MSSLVGVGRLLQALFEKLGSVAENALGILA